VSDNDIQRRELKINLMDFDWGFWRDDDPMGFTTVSLAKVREKKQVDEWYRLGDGGNGTLHLVLQFVPLLEEAVSLPKELRIPADPRVSQAILTILLFEVQMSHLVKPMIVLEVSGRGPATSSPGQLALNWEFAEEFLIPIHCVRSDKVTLSLVDYNAQVGVANRYCAKIKDFIADSDDPQTVKKYQRERHYLLGKRVFDVIGEEGFTGFKQQIDLYSSEGGIYKVILKGRLFYLRNQEYKEGPC